MKKLSLISLSLLNFKGLTFSFSPDGKNASILADNGLGKTTIKNAEDWLFTTSPSAGYEIKNITADGECEHNLKHEVLGTFDLDGEEIRLRKTYTEVWSGKRGSSTKALTSHTVKYYFGDMDVAIGPREYLEKLSTIGKPEYFPILTDPLYLAEKMKWQDRRAMLISLCGDVPDSVILSSNPDLAPLAESLKSRSIDDHKKVMTAAKKAADEKLGPINAKIEENAIALKAAEGINHLVEIEKVNKLSIELDQITATIADLKSGDGLVELRRQLAEAENSAYRATVEHGSRMQAIKFDQREALNVLGAELIPCRRIIQVFSEELQGRLDVSVDLDQQIINLRAEWNRIDAEQKAYSPESCCPMCGQDIPEGKRFDAKSAHQNACAERKKEINTKGQAAAAMLAETKKRIAELEEQAKTAAEKETELSAKIAEEQAKDLTADERLTDAKAAISMAASLIESIKAKMSEVEAGQVDNEAITRAEIKAEEIKTAIAEARKKIAIVEASQKAADRKAEFETEEKALQVEVERCGRELDMIDRFTRAKVASLEGRINSMFELAKFKLFATAINGNIEPCCQVLSNGVPFESNLNNGARIQTGLDIIKTISGLQGLAVPVFIDNNESVTKLPEMDCQVIGMFVSAQDKILRVEIAK